MAMLLHELDRAQMWREDGREEGRVEGREEGRIFSKIEDALDDGLNAEEIIYKLITLKRKPLSKEEAKNYLEEYCVINGILIK